MVLRRDRRIRPRRDIASLFGRAVALALVLACVPALASADDFSNWTRSFGGVCLSSPSIRNSFVYVGTSAGTLHVLRQGDGRLKWRYETGRRGAVTPLVSHGTVWLSQTDGSVHALNAFTGKLLWKYRPTAPDAGPTRLSPIPPPVMLRGRLYQREKGRIVGIAAGTGKVEVSLRVPGYDVSYPAVCSGSILLGVGDSLHALAPRLDRVGWSRKLGDDGPLTPAVADDGTAFTATRRGYVFGIDGSNGVMRWKYSQLPSPPMDVSTDGRGVFISTGKGSLYCLEAATGKLRWRFDTEGSVLARPVASGSSLLFGSNDGKLYSVGLDDGRFEWSYDTKQEFIGAVSVEGDELFVAASGRDGPDTLTRLVAFNINDALSSTAPFSIGRFSGRRVEQDVVSTVLVDNGTAAARTTVAGKGLLASIGWPLRFLSALGNPSSMTGGAQAHPTKSSLLADALAASGGALLLTAGPGAIFGFLLLFLVSAVGLVAAGLPLIGHLEAASYGEEAAGTRWWGGIRVVLSNRWMLGVAYGSELSIVPLVLLARVIVGPAGGAAWVLVLWMTVLWISTVALSVLARGVLLKGAAEIRGGRRRRLRRFLPSPAEAVRLLTLYILILIFATVTFIGLSLAAVFGLRWLLIPIGVLVAASLPLQYADGRIVLAKESLPSALLSASRIAVQRPASVISYSALAAFALLLPVPAALISGAWAPLAALLFAPIMACLLAVHCVEIVDPDRRSFAFTGTNAPDTIELRNGD
ncbi:MAG: hypothetical protein C4521_11265 [Actinobacteria bacterium]|nr:MAG: hypothetical protein C4521_11265 [Actinomycetota bacterium]